MKRVDHGLAELIPCFRRDVCCLAFITTLAVDVGRGHVADEAVRQSKNEGHVERRLLARSMVRTKG